MGPQIAKLDESSTPARCRETDGGGGTYNSVIRTSMTGKVNPGGCLQCFSLRHDSFRASLPESHQTWQVRVPFRSKTQPGIASRQGLSTDMLAGPFKNRFSQRGIRYIENHTGRTVVRCVRNCGIDQELLSDYTPYAAIFRKKRFKMTGQLSCADCRLGIIRIIKSNIKFHNDVDLILL